MAFSVCQVLYLNVLFVLCIFHSHTSYSHMLLKTQNGLLKRYVAFFCHQTCIKLRITVWLQWSLRVLKNKPRMLWSMREVLQSRQRQVTISYYSDPWTIPNNLAMLLTTLWTHLRWHLRGDNVESLVNQWCTCYLLATILGTSSK